MSYGTPCADDFEAERSDLLRRISSCSASASESHGLRCAAQKRADEVRELQQALSAAHVHLFEERDRLLRLQAENDDLRLQEAEDRRRIQHLMSLTNPVDQEITLQPGSDPSSGILYPRNAGGKQKHGALSSTAMLSSVRRAHAIQAHAVNRSPHQAAVLHCRCSVREWQPWGLCWGGQLTGTTGVAHGIPARRERRHATAQGGELASAAHRAKAAGV